PTARWPTPGRTASRRSRSGRASSVRRRRRSSPSRSASIAGATCPPPDDCASIPPMPLRLLYVMDPLARVLVDKDTTFAFMLEGQRRGHEQYYAGVDDLFADGAMPHASVRRAEVQRAAVHYTLSEARTLPLAWFDVVFMRKDPPFDLGYFFATHLLGLVDPQVTFVINDPRGLREANEKLYALRFPEVIPE